MQNKVNLRTAVERLHDQFSALEFDAKHEAVYGLEKVYSVIECSELQVKYETGVRLCDQFLQVIRILTFCVFIRNSIQSVGDRSPFYQKCLEKCTSTNCSTDGVEFINNKQQPIILQITQWRCSDECGHECMWHTVLAFNKRNWKIPQFHGKWPFIRILGLQEPASVVFSLLNLYVHLKMVTKFRWKIDSNTPTYFLWHIFAIVSINAWFWSTIFHARDFPFTELMDYSCAFSLVLISCYCMCLRILRNVPPIVLCILTVLFVGFFFNHTVYLSSGQFSYSYNMELNILIGGLTAFSWFAWCVWNRKQQPYTWKCALFVTLAALSTLLELIDQPPLFFIYDFHSLWHLSSAPLTVLFYNFVIEDLVTHMEPNEKLLPEKSEEEPVQFNEIVERVQNSNRHRVNNNIFASLKLAVKKLKNHNDKLYAIVFDDMCLNSLLSFSHKMMGIEDFGTTRSKCIAKYANVFMAKEITNEKSLPREAEDTTDFILFMDGLFNSLNGNHNIASSSKPLKGGITTASNHEDLWRQSIAILKSVRFLDKRTNKPITVPSIVNLIKTLEGFFIP
ncbi:hypothetical protein FQA39_LY18301 [Lamprigera yunnana]|nr:hypothetical protein FQA39_LY18301 [Lamprigera yunnana]